MPDGVYVGVALGTVLVLSLTIREVVNRRALPEFMSITQLFLAANGLVAGVRVGYMSLAMDDGKLDPFATEDRLYLFLGGLALALASVKATIEIFSTANALVHASEE